MKYERKTVSLRIPYLHSAKSKPEEREAYLQRIASIQGVVPPVIRSSRLLTRPGGQEYLTSLQKAWPLQGPGR
jgi:hypothetical protein